jgi:hypothetical protein
LADKSRNLSQAEKKITVDKSEQIHKMTIFLFNLFNFGNRWQIIAIFEID